MLRSLALALILASAATTGCASDDADPQTPSTPTPPTAAVGKTQEVDLAGGTTFLGPQGSIGGATNTTGSHEVVIWPNVTALRMELEYEASASSNPRVYGLPDCEWRMPSLLTGSNTETVECPYVVPGTYEVIVEHDTGTLRMTVHVIATVPA